jgi:methylase of polypeptide subunit release factors
MPTYPTITWQENNREHHARWRAENGSSPPKRVVIADDTMKADVAYRFASEGTAMLWRGDFHNAKQLLQAMARRIDAKRIHPNRGDSKRIDAKAPTKAHNNTNTNAAQNKDAPVDIRDAFNRHRLAQSQRARTLSMLLIPFNADYSVPLTRAPDVSLACTEGWGASDGDTKSDSIASLRELLGLIGAHEWRKKGVEVAALGARVHPHYGVFAPIRAEYVDLLSTIPLPSPAPALAFDIGTGTGVLAAVLAKRGIARVIATDQDARALTCARENLARLGLTKSVAVVEADLFPDGRAPLIVCNPPWLPARPSSPLEHAIYDADSRMLRGFLNRLAAHLEPNGEGWLILSDLAEHLGLRTRETLLEWISAAGLAVVTRHDVRPTHPRVTDANDALHAARAKEVTSIWRLRAAKGANT